MKKYITIILAIAIIFNLQIAQAHAGYIKISEGVYQKAVRIKKENKIIEQPLKIVPTPEKIKTPTTRKCKRFCVSA